MENYNIKIGPLEWDFVPEFGEGKITASLRQLSVEEYDDCVNVFTGRTIDRGKMISYGLTKLQGLEVGGEIIKDAKGLLAAPGRTLMQLFSELWLAIDEGSVVTEEESKN